MSKLLSPEQIAFRLGIDRRDVYRLIKDWPQVRLSERRIRIDESTLEAYIDSKRTGPTWDTSINAARSGGATTRTRRPANDTNAAPAPETSESPPSDSDSGNSKPSRKRAAGSSH